MSDQPFLHVKDVTKVYRPSKKSEVHALKGINLEIKKGEVFSLLGVNGAGKTTLSSILAALHPCSGGDVLIEGRSIYEDIIGYKERVALCNQKPNLDKRINLNENMYYAGLCFGLSHEEALEKRDALMKEFKLTRYAEKDISSLSGGYKQRFMIARTLMHEPEVVILDEPTVALDPGARHVVHAKVRELRDRGITVILTTHYIEEAESMSDRVCFIHDGRVRLIDTPENLVSSFKAKNLEAVFIELTEMQDE